MDLGPCVKIVATSNGDYEERLNTAFSESRLYECRRCSLQYRHPRPTADQLEELYESIADDRWDYASKQVTSWRLAYRAIANQLHEARVRLLDVGAFDGSFLKTLPDDWDKSAIEPSQAARNRLLQNGVRCIGKFLNMPTKGERGEFDVVTLFDVFEHLPKPRESLQYAVEYLKPGGWLLLSTGNTEHWTWKLLRGEHWYLNTPQHISFGNPTFFRCVSRQLGCRVVRITSHSHQHGTTRDRLRQAFETIHYGLRMRSGLRRNIAGAIQRIPRFRYLLHRQGAPHTPALQDHLFVILEKK